MDILGYTTIFFSKVITQSVSGGLGIFKNLLSHSKVRQKLIQPPQRPQFLKRYKSTTRNDLR
jgi:hypothetical protein